MIIPVYGFGLNIAQDAHVRKNKQPSLEAVQGAWSHDPELNVVLKEKQEYAPVRSDKVFGIKVARCIGEIDTNLTYKLTMRVEDISVSGNPVKDFSARRHIVRAGHYMSLCIPQVCARHQLRHKEIEHGVPWCHVRGSIP